MFPIPGGMGDPMGSNNRPTTQPSTPTPHRFLIKPRPSTQKLSTPLGPNSQKQFQATPRFSLQQPSSAPRPRPLASSSQVLPPLQPQSQKTPGPASTPAAFLRQTQRRLGLEDDIACDGVESSSPLDLGQDHDDDDHDDNDERDGRVRDVLESSSSPSGLGAEHETAAESPSSVVEEHDEESDEWRYDDDVQLPKRRRLSLSSFASPLRETSPPEEEAEDDRMITDPFLNYDSDPDAADLSIADRLSDLPSPPLPSTQPVQTEQQQQLQQPGFHIAPRFRPQDPQLQPLPAKPKHDPLPDLFSPRHRNMRHAPGGMVSALREWLMNLEANTVPKQDDEWTVRVMVSEVRRDMEEMAIMVGTVVRDEENEGPESVKGFVGDKDGEAEVTGLHTSTEVKILLTGQGRITGLDRRKEVKTGDVVGISSPMWDVELGEELGDWVVVCNWAVLENG